MTDEILTDDGTELVRAAAATEARPAERRIDVRLVAWGEVAENTPEGIRETFARGAFRGTEPGRVVLEHAQHGGAIVGAAEAVQERDDGAYATFRVARTPAGDELLELASPGPAGEPPILRDASVVFRPRRSVIRADGVFERRAVDLVRVAVLPRGAYPSAQVLAVRSEVLPVTAPDIAPAAPAVDLSPVLSRMDGLDARMGAIETLAAVPHARRTNPLAAYPSLGHYAQAVYRGEAAADLVARELLLERTFADQITSQNDGINPVAWLKDVRRIVDLGRRAINAFGGPAPLPDKGMSIKYPFLSSSNTVVGVQSTQNTEIQSARIDIDDGDGTISTYAGGSAISRQLLDRGDPSYLDAYQRIMTIEWSKVTDAAFVTALEAGSQTQTMGNALGTPVSLATSAHADDIFDTAAAHGFSVGDAIVFTSLTGGDATTAALVNRVVWVTATSFAAQTFRPSLTPGGAAITWGTADLSAGTVAKVNTTAAGIRTSLFQASVQCETATGAPASIALASTDVFLALAGLTDIVPRYAGNPSNASGMAQADDLRININGLDITHKSSVTAGKMIVSNPIAARWHEDGPKWLDADNAQKLAKDVSVYSFGVGLVTVPAGVVEITFA